MSPPAVSLSRFLAQQGSQEPHAAPQLCEAILEMSFAAKVIGREIRRAALVGRLGLVGEKNPTGDSQKKLDVYANEIVIDAFRSTGAVAAIVSEELEELRTISCSEAAEHILCVDPLDGSSNTDINGAVGTIFSFYRRAEPGSCAQVGEELYGAVELAAAGYVLYGPSTVLVYSLGGVVSGFTLDHDVGEFLLSHEDIRCPPQGPYYSANLGRYHDWDGATQSFANYLIERDPGTGRPYSLRYSGALVADVHRSLLEGGVYLYPADASNPEGKLRLFYECAPLAFVTERAGGRATTGREPILELRRTSLHQQVALAIGSSEDVSLYERFVASGGP